VLSGAEPQPKSNFVHFSLKRCHGGNSCEDFLDIITVRDKLTRLPLFHLQSVMLDHFVLKHATAHKVNSYYTLAISHCTFCVGKHTVLGPEVEEFVCWCSLGRGLTNKKFQSFVNFALSKYESPV